jgi:hypothetical protein
MRQTASSYPSWQPNPILQYTIEVSRMMSVSYVFLVEDSMEWRSHVRYDGGASAGSFWVSALPNLSANRVRSPRPEVMLGLPTGPQSLGHFSTPLRYFGTRKIFSKCHLDPLETVTTAILWLLGLPHADLTPKQGCMAPNSLLQ